MIFVWLLLLILNSGFLMVNLVTGQWGYAALALAGLALSLYGASRENRRV